ncbi:MAG: AAA family ATPase [Bacteroidales bacterium]|jgi:wobble nucleotide-excising tRNase|nr:AAA family ATPase [Bacteroidales bacterium]
MITKVNISNFGLFNDFQWTKRLNDSNFQEVNIIYGRNYSGKTTLSRIFRCFEQHVIPKNYSESRFEIIDDNNNSYTQDNISTNNFVRVYNTDFVNDNLSWLHDDKNGSIRPFTLLGSDNISAKKRIENIEKELGNIEEHRGLLYEQEQMKKQISSKEQELQKRKNELENKLKSEANQNIKKSPYYVQQGEAYNVTNIRNDINTILNGNDYDLNEEKIASHKKIIDERIKSTINNISTNKPKFEEYKLKAKNLVEKKITISNTIKELLDDNILQEWVNKGRELHKQNKEQCAFCGNSITSDRWRILDEHFSKESEELKKKLKEEKEKIEKSIEALKNYLDEKKIIKDNYYIQYQNDFTDIHNKWSETIQNYINSMELIINVIQKRYDDIFNPLFIDDDIIDYSNEIISVLNEFNALSVKNNEKTNTLNNDKKLSRDSLRYNEIKKFISIINYEKEGEHLCKDEEEISKLKQPLEDINKKIETLYSEKKEEESKLKDEGKAASKVNNHLSKFFGHDGLSLEHEVEMDSKQTKFVIKRGNKKAYNLSEGECSLISFCYFIAKMEDELSGTENKQLIIYIDDPISSLDSNHIFFMFSLIETIIAKDKRYGQLFISTHNLEFLKYLKRLTLSKDTTNYYVVEKKKKGDEYRCSIEKMPSYMKDYVTEYNFLFSEIYKMVKPSKGDRAKCFENSFTWFYNLPNNMRKFLECYLFYRYPNTDDPLKNLHKLFDNNIPPLVNRLINEYSHLSWGDRGSLVSDVDEAETVAKHILKAIKKDNEHFEALCDSIGEDKNILIE